MLYAFAKGLAVGFAIAMPVGPIGVLCIRRTLSSGWMTGLVTGLGAASADAIYGSIAAFGFTFVTSALLSLGPWLRILGGLYLCYLGATTLLRRETQSADEGGTAVGAAGAYLSALGLTLTNPMTIMSFSAIMAGLGLGLSGLWAAMGFIAGVFAGSALWWVTLSATVALAGARLGDRALRWTRLLAGMVLTAFGIAAIVG